MSAQVAFSRSAAELEGLLAVEQARVDVLRRVHHLRVLRKSILDQVEQIDRELAALEEPLRQVLREPLPRFPIETTGHCPQCGALIFIGHPHICIAAVPR